MSARFESSESHAASSRPQRARRGVTYTDGTFAQSSTPGPFDGFAAKRPFLDKTQPEAYRRLMSVSASITQAAASARVGLDLVELVNLRASQINGCAYCLSVHTPKALKVGVTEQQIMLLPAWKDVDVFTPEQRAALAISEALTYIQPSAELEALILDALELLGEERYSVLAWAAITINAFNRLSIASRHPVK